MRPLFRRPLSFSLRNALVMMAVTCVVLAFAGRRAKRVLDQKRAAQAIVAVGGDVITDADNADDASVDPFSAPDWKLAFGLAKLPRVVEVYLPYYFEKDDGVRDALPHLAALPDLQKLELVGERWDDACCAYLEPLDSLLELTVEGNEALTAVGFACLVRPKLQSLFVWGADLHGLENRNLVWPATLKSIQLVECQGLSGRAFAPMLGPALEEIDVDAGEFRDEQLLGVPAPARLADLTMTNCDHLTGRGIQPLLGPSLYTLRLRGSLTDADLRSLQLPPSLARLELRSILFSNACTTSIAQACPQLEYLWLHGLLLDDGCIDALARLSRCERMDLEDTFVGSAACAELSGKLNAECNLFTKHGVYRNGQLVKARGGFPLQPPTAPGDALDVSEVESEQADVEQPASEPE
ncbi:MAG: hypothetical protein U0836_10620 [Pirellulales bacterium]